MIDLPPELVEKLAQSSPTASRVVLGGEYGVRMHSDEEAVHIVLAALIAHAGPDANYIDLSTWEGVRAHHRSSCGFDPCILIWVGLSVLNALALAGSVWIIVLTLRSMEVIS